MKKRIFAYVAVLVLLLFSVWCFASETKWDSVRVAPTGDDTYGFSVDYPDGTRVWSVTKAGVVYAPIVRAINLPIMAVMATNSTYDTVYGGPLINSGIYPGLGCPPVALHASQVAIAWATGFTTPVAITFRVPTDYYSGGAFRVLATQSTGDSSIDFDVTVNKGSTAFDNAATDQTAVNMRVGTTSPEVVTLTPATDFASLAAGDWVTLRYWRSAGTGTTYVHDVEFFYTASQ
jgi:hypothetical protein